MGEAIPALPTPNYARETGGSYAPSVMTCRRLMLVRPGEHTRRPIARLPAYRLRPRGVWPHMMMAARVQNRRHHGVTQHQAFAADAIERATVVAASIRDLIRLYCTCIDRDRQRSCSRVSERSFGLVV
ncbi:hypothetical protein SAMD00023353_0101440 [Rosellinia necatrix]|uniref:Uncharacterized protein n=1 Tax=Rosellinia necatrix TaxID=77044 RepID=A0A1S8A4R4_ROSNE|nr:hypothetical protein SAMD00023353_0101440 [Rosellinia necatrix]